MYMLGAAALRRKLSVSRWGYKKRRGGGGGGGSGLSLKLQETILRAADIIIC